MNSIELIQQPHMNLRQIRSVENFITRTASNYKKYETLTRNTYQLENLKNALTPAPKLKNFFNSPIKSVKNIFRNRALKKMIDEKQKILNGIANEFRAFIGKEEIKNYKYDNNITAKGLDYPEGIASIGDRNLIAQNGSKTFNETNGYLAQNALTLGCN